MRGCLILAALAAATAARAQQRPTVEVRFNPAVSNLQMAVWVEDSTGHYVDTLYVSRSTGSLGLANRPGTATFKTDFRFPYGRRDMVLPVWAHRRDHHYGYVVMGGKAGNSIATCEASGITGTDCDDLTIGYHFGVSSPEPFYCSPRGGVTMKVNGVDVVSCASAFYGCKGAYADAPLFSLYPPRADLTSFESDHDGPDAMKFSSVNDLVAVSGATPAGAAIIDPPIRWTPPDDGPFVAWVEMSAEKDFNMYHNHPNTDDEHGELNGYGQPFLGQPSILYAVPFTVAATSADVELTSSYAGYSDWDGASGTLHPPDFTISDTPGSGAGRLLDNVDKAGAWRVKVDVVPAGMVICDSPRAPTGLTLTPHSNALELAFASAASGPPTNRFDVRYSDKPITEDNFLDATPSSDTPPPVGAQGSTVQTLIGGLRPQIQYFVAVRAISMCGAVSPIATAQASTTMATFVTLHGCFIATAAYGTPLAGELDVLRRLRDRRLLTNPLGQLAVATYYAFSPPVANAIASDERLRAAARRVIAPLVEAARAGERLAP